jgi:hypothetical protein
MGLLQKAEITMAYFKCGIFGFQGDGKTYTASLLAEGILKAIGENKMAYFDTETGSDWMVPKMKQSGIEVFQVKMRAFTALINTIKECVEINMPFLIIDSITHVWRDLMQSYDEKLNRRGKLQFQDWAIIKKEWQTYTDLFVNSPLHIIVCGRAGYAYDYDFNEDGSKDLIKTGTKMKAEGEFGFEPSLVIEMERITENRKELDAIKDRKKKQAYQPSRGSKSVHRAMILKDRSDTINGQVFEYSHESDRTIFDDIKPHFELLNIGGMQLGVDTQDSKDRFDIEGKPDWKREQEMKKIALEEIQGTMVALWPGTDKDSKKAKSDFVWFVFNTRSWSAVEALPLKDLEDVKKLLTKFEEAYTISDTKDIAVVWREILMQEEDDIPL